MSMVFSVQRVWPALGIAAAGVWLVAAGPALAQRDFRNEPQDNAGKEPGLHSAPRYQDQDNATRAHVNGEILALRVIERSYIPAMKRRGADYIGSEFDGANGRYRLKFMRQNTVIWVDVDGRTGQVVAIAGD